MIAEPPQGLFFLFNNPPKKTYYIAIVTIFNHMEIRNEIQRRQHMCDVRIEDFGEKIGGARKDLYSLSNIMELNDEELSQVTRDKIWKKPNIVKLVKEGVDKCLLYWQEMIRKSIPLHPVIGYTDDGKTVCKNYIRIVNQLKSFSDNAEKIDIEGLRGLLMQHFIREYGYRYSPCTEEGRSILSRGVFDAINTSPEKIAKLVEREHFGLDPQAKRHAEAESQYGIGRFFTHPINACDIEGYQGEALYYLDPDKQQPGTVAVSTKGLYLGTYFFYEGRFPEGCDSWDKDNSWLVTEQHGRPILNGFDSKEAADGARKALVEAQAAFANAKAGGKARKTKFMPPQLDFVKQTGFEASDVTGDDYMNVFGFRAGEFGNWMNDLDRQKSLDMGFIAFKNLASLLGISDDGISLGHQLAIAFGSRGIAKARAHYEPARNVINLTKMKGAGCVAHEWAHALDKRIGTMYGATSLASEDLSDWSYKPKHAGIPEEFSSLIEAMRYNFEEVEADYDTPINKAKDNLKKFMEYEGRNITDEATRSTWQELSERLMEEACDGNLMNPDTINNLSSLKKSAIGRGLRKEDRESIMLYQNDLNCRIRCKANGPTMTKNKKPTQFYEGSKKFGNSYSRDGGYWESKEEMFARAFDCYISDKLKEMGIQDTYLSSSADCFWMPGLDGDENVYAIPVGEERKKINAMFDKLFERLRSDGTFTVNGN